MRKLENQKEIIFNTAKDIFTSDEVEKFSVRMISRRCKIGMGTIYKYYGNKDEILLDIVRDLWMNYIAEVKATKRVFCDLISYIEYLFEELKKYSERFNYLILSRELTSSIRKEGYKRHKNAQVMFVSIIQEKVSFFYEIDFKNTQIISEFIANNLIAMITNEGYGFKVFKHVCIELFKQFKEKRI